ncbi:DNA polymerase IV [Mesomycoplasma conjunctivae]|uniref:DNA polymerase IV n=1 Tax=Mesomycoplasma conjunctivae (strain ATCC 25834 / NCTC 10147 / HRC/581) TaxID=572263 RepID=C5J784_MESCH|nr:DNA polymerase IV [Mesomycoplasma conjunctivae]CAT05347.1 DNA polymerase IV [Mesomycoplasma conjunctivae]VEU66574.1 DNA polymerase IV [Mesomycoplasma conjunctivae]
MSKIIAHIDINTFFVSAEIRLKPELKKQPVAIARSDKFAMAVSISKQVKEKGFKITDKLSQIKSAIPDLVIIKPNLKYYQFLSKKFFQYIVKNFSKKIEIYSIDECFVDLSKFAKNFRTIKSMIYYIKNKIETDLELPCSIGISYNKFLAKMATNLAKNTRENIFILPRSKIETHIYNLPIQQLFGIGKSTSRLLNEKKVYTIKDFLNLGINNEILIKIMGTTRNYFYQNLLEKGDDVILDKESHFKSVSRFNTFLSSETIDAKQIALITKEFCSDLLTKLQMYQKNTARIEIYYHNYLGKTIRYWKNLDTPSNDFNFISTELLFLVEKIDNYNNIKGFGVRFSKLANQKFDSTMTKSKVKKIINKINAQHGSKSAFILNNTKNNLF